MAKKFTVTFRPVQAVASALGRKPQQSVQRSPRPKLLISIVNKGSGCTVRGILNDLSVGLSFSFTGIGTARSVLLDYLGIGESEKTIVFSIFPEADEGAIMRELRSQMSLYLAGKGISFTVPLAGISEKIAGGLLGAATSKTLEGQTLMGSEDRKYNLIVVAINSNYVDEAMSAARKAGASGGTVVRARAADNEKAEQFIGVNLLREQELLLILCKKESTQAIMDELSEHVGLKTPAGGVIFALPVDKTAGISIADETEDANNA